MSGPAGTPLSDELGENTALKIAGSGGVAFSQKAVGTFHDVVPHAAGAMDNAANPVQPEQTSVAQTADLTLTAKPLNPAV